MSSRVPRGRLARVIGLAVLALLGSEVPFAKHDEALAGPAGSPGPVEIGGQYSIYFNGFDIGAVRLEHRFSGKTYTASSDVDISALLGAFRWKGVTRAAGSLTADGVRPSGYDFEFAGTSKSGSVRMGFSQGAVTHLSAIPMTAEPDDFVPLAPQHLKSVIDPLSALAALSRPGQPEPCGRKLAVFDGKQRFDVALVGLRREAVPAGRNGATVEGVVCRVKYTPVAGYRANDDTRALAQNAGIEVTFRPVAEANLWVPYRVQVPTIAGSVSLEATRYDISVPGMAEIALVE
jgi:hypothetical protein